MNTDPTPDDTIAGIVAGCRTIHDGLLIMADQLAMDPSPATVQRALFVMRTSAMGFGAIADVLNELAEETR